MPKKSKVIRFRVNPQMDSYLKDLTNEMKALNPDWNKSELIRCIIQYFMMAQMMGQISKPFEQVKKDFNEFLSTTQPSHEAST